MGAWYLEMEAKESLPPPEEIARQLETASWK
jgi:hypothetical protein